jgi:membrane dipeptidase
MTETAAAPDPALTVELALSTTPVVDGRNDLPTALRTRAGSSIAGLETARPEFHTDLPRLRTGGVGAQFWSVSAPSHLPEPETVVSTLEQIDAVYRMVARYPEDLRIAYTAADVESAFFEGRIASLLGAEGGPGLTRSTELLRTLARLGVRYVTLAHDDNAYDDNAHDDNTARAGSATGKPGSDIPGADGLDPADRAVISELNRIGVLADLSHAAESTQRAVLAASRAPVLFSHSCTRAVNDHPRNISDPVLESVRANGGVVQLTFVPALLSAQVAEWTREFQAERRRQGLDDRPRHWPRAPRPDEHPEHPEHPGNLADEAATAANDKPDEPPRERLRGWRERNPRPEATVAQVADHIEHARDVAGIDHIGLGGAYDGDAPQPAGLADVSSYPTLLRALAARGWSRSELEALTGRNVLRVLRAAEDAASDPLWPAPRSH